MKNNEVTLEDAGAEAEIYEDEPPEIVEVVIKDAVLLGFCFGVGLGAALFCYGMLALLLAKEMLKLSLLP